MDKPRGWQREREKCKQLTVLPTRTFRTSNSRCSHVVVVTVVVAVVHDKVRVCLKASDSDTTSNFCTPITMLGNSKRILLKPPTVLDIPEVLDIISSFNDRASNARCARTCRAWSDVALNHVWRENPPLKALLELLVPLVPRAEASEEKNRKLVFSRTIHPSDWKRFNSFAKRVKHFTLSHSEWYMHGRLEGMIHDSVLYEVSMTRPGVCLLPRLKNLSIEVESECFIAWLQCPLLFMHDALSTISIKLDEVKVIDAALPLISALLGETLCRSPHLTRFDLCVPLSTRHIESDLGDLLKGLLCLKELFLSTCMLTSQVIRSIANLPRLVTIGSVWDSYGSENKLDVKNLQAPETKVAFPNLAFLSIQSQVSSITRFFQSTGAPQSLVGLTIDTLFSYLPSELQSCLEALAIACPMLEYLEFTLSADPLGTDASAESITFSVLYPLTSFLVLATFKLASAYCVDMADRELVGLIKGCKFLLSFHLNSEPIYDSKTSLTLGCLALLAQGADQTYLDELSVYLDATKTDSLPQITKQITFERISFGASPVSKTDDLLVYLSRLLHSSCEIDCDSFLTQEAYDMLSHPYSREFDRRTQKWQEIKKVLPLLRKVRQDEKVFIQLKNEAGEAESDSDLDSDLGMLKHQYLLLRKIKKTSELDTKLQYPTGEKQRKRKLRTSFLTFRHD
ncbi:hypothetical protein DFH11DRAFT_1548099 [Phellopilus nigrolimitatus]|nr:hypothetical protein DFH11DRAFT_1548099 [Phellopilus nigrolimitatus]